MLLGALHINICMYMQHSHFRPSAKHYCVCCISEMHYKNIFLVHALLSTVQTSSAITVKMVTYLVRGRLGRIISVEYIHFDGHHQDCMILHDDSGITNALSLRLTSIHLPTRPQASATLSWLKSSNLRDSDYVYHVQTSIKLLYCLVDFERALTLDTVCSLY